MSSYINVDRCVGFGELGWCGNAGGAQRRHRRHRDELLTRHTAAAATAILVHKKTHTHIDTYSSGSTRIKAIVELLVLFTADEIVPHQLVF